MMWHMRTSRWALISLVLMLSACGDDHEETEQHTVWVRATQQTIQPRLYYRGVIRPIRLYTVSSPVDGYALTVPKLFGDQVKRGEVLFSLSAPKAEKAFRESLMTYLKNKDVYETSLSQLENERSLLKEGIISKNDFRAKRSKLEAEYLQMLQQRTELNDHSQILGVSGLTLSKLKLHDQAALQKVLSTLHHVSVRAPIAGSVLPPNGLLGHGAKEKRIEPGSQLEHGQTLAYIGDLSGVMVEVAVSEHDIARLKPGLHAIVTGDAFPGIQLKGSVESIDLYGVKPAKADGRTSAKFPVRIAVPALSKQAIRCVKPGMSAMVELQLSSMQRLIVPIAAVHESNGRRFVMVKRGERQIQIPVHTGPTTQGGVVITSGLSAGEQVATAH